MFGNNSLLGRGERLFAVGQMGMEPPCAVVALRRYGCPWIKMWELGQENLEERVGEKKCAVYFQPHFTESGIHCFSRNVIS